MTTSIQFTPDITPAAIGWPETGQSSPCPSWCSHDVCEPFEDVDGTHSLKTVTLYEFTEDLRVEVVRNDTYGPDGWQIGAVEYRAPEMWEMACHGESIVKAALDALFAFGQVAR